MKVFLVQDIVPNYRVPVFARIAGLSGVDLTVFYSQASRAMQAENLKNADDMTGFRHVELPLIDRGGDACYQFGLLRHIWKERPDVVIAGGAGRPDRLAALLLCKLLGARFLWFLGGVPCRDPVKIREYSQRGWMNRVFGVNNPRWLASRQADGMIVYSKHARDYYIGLGFPRDRIWVAPNSPDTDRLETYHRDLASQPTSVQVLRRRFAPAGQKVVFTLGRLNKARQLDVLLHALKSVGTHVPNVVLVVVGDGSERDALARQAEALGAKKVHFVGAIYDDGLLAQYFAICDVFVTPGVASLAVKMAMAFGKPVITVDYGLEVHDVRDGENGFVFDMGDVQGLSERLIQLLSDDLLRETMGREGRRTISEEINIDRMVGGFTDAIGSDSHAGGEANNRIRSDNV